MLGASGGLLWPLESRGGALCPFLSAVRFLVGFCALTRWVRPLWDASLWRCRMKVDLEGEDLVRYLALRRARGIVSLPDLRGVRARPRGFVSRLTWRQRRKLREMFRDD
jgi:hypothetical protein